MSDWLGAPLSTGTLAAFMARGAEDLAPFLDKVHAQITASPVAYFDETGARAAGKLRWLFCSSTERATFYSLHDRRGIDGLEHAGVLPNFSGVAVHDGFKPYRNYTNLEHALCNVHHLRELLGVPSSTITQLLHRMVGSADGKVPAPARDCAARRDLLGLDRLEPAGAQVPSRHDPIVPSATPVRQDPDREAWHVATHTASCMMRA